MMNKSEMCMCVCVYDQEQEECVPRNPVTIVMGIGGIAPKV